MSMANMCILRASHAANWPAGVDSRQQSDAVTCCLLYLWLAVADAGGWESSEDAAFFCFMQRKLMKQLQNSFEGKHSMMVLRVYWRLAL